MARKAQKVLNQCTIGSAVDVEWDSFEKKLKWWQNVKERFLQMLHLQVRGKRREGRADCAYLVMGCALRLAQRYNFNVKGNNIEKIITIIEKILVFYQIKV